MRRGRTEQAGELSAKIGKLISEHRASKLSKVNPADTKSLWASVGPTLRNNRNNNKKFSLFSADELNTHFSSVATDTDLDPGSMQDIIDGIAKDAQADDFEPIFEYEVYQLLAAVHRTAPGPDKIPYWFYKYCAAELANVIAYIINLTLRCGAPPAAWKKAIITPIPKVNQPQQCSDYRPISVTSILSRIVEKFIVRKFIIPALPVHDLHDQFAYKPSGSTTSALIAINHYVTHLLESHSYVRCVLLDFSKAFDTINHPILFRKLQKLNLPANILLWICRFLTDRVQAVHIGGSISNWSPINQSIVQGSGLGPYLYIIYAADLKSLHSCNFLVKYADDTTLIVAEHSAVSIADEMENIQKWSRENKLTLNFKKTKEVIFRRTSKRNLKLPTPLPDIERVERVTLLGIQTTSTLSAADHVNYILSQANQRLYLLSRLKSLGLSSEALDILYSALIVSKITYGLISFFGQLSIDDINRLNAFFKKSKKWGVITKLFDLCDLAENQDRKLFSKITDVNHCLNVLLPPPKSKVSYDLRQRGHNYPLPDIRYKLFRNSFINRCLFKYK